MRGTPVPGFEPVMHGGIIPAYAGNTDHTRSGWIRAWDHPRVCGEHVGRLLHRLDGEGSSPRMRGTPYPCPPRVRPDGIIPAYAGNTTTWGSGGVYGGDHPRVCGEHTDAPNCPVLYEGSSPRMRGTQGGVRIRGVPIWIIPAYAGNTLCLGSPGVAIRDHPRVCGEHAMAKGEITADEGSSPRMRGTLVPWTAGLHRRGIIPAYAGNTLMPGMRHAGRWDHPRVCGEHA